MQGLVTKSTGSWYKVLAEGKEYEARLRGKIRMQNSKATNPVVVGDFVEVDTQDDELVITDILPRKNVIERKSNKLSKQKQIIAANIDLAVIISSPSNPRTPQGFIDRFLVAAEAYHIPTINILNKSDLQGEKIDSYRNYLLKTYNEIGYMAQSHSFLDPSSLGEIKELFANKTVLLSGNSGVGKSTLVNALTPNANQKIGRISESYHKGMHTTTFAQMFLLDNGIKIIDTPGIKDFGMYDLQENQLAHYFPDFKPLIPKCKFYDCKHDNEPECAVLQAVIDEKLNENRYINYLQMLAELREKKKW